MANTTRPLTISLNDQCYWGFFLALTTSFAISDKSWSDVAWWLSVGLLFFLPTLARRGFHRRTRSSVTAAWLLLAAFVLVIAMAVTSVAERLVFINASTYPAWLASGTVPADSSDKEMPLRQESMDRLCRGIAGPKMLIHKDNGVLLLRCSPFGFWPFTRTYITHAK
jgi:hypothetical protein